MEKVYVTLTLLLAVLAISGNVVEGRARDSKMGTWWRRQTKPVSHSGSYSYRGSAGNRWRDDNEEESISSPPATRPAKVSSADCTAAGFYPTPGSCTHFYRCVDWLGDGSFFSVFNFNCPAGTVFDDSLDICNHAGWAGRPECGGTAGGSGDQTTESEDQTTESGDQVTSSGDQTPESGAETTTSGYETGSGSTTEKEEEGVFTLTCYSDNKYRQHPLYCNKYYYCIHDGDVWSVPSLTCPKDLVFDEVNQICKEPGTEHDNCKFAPYDESSGTKAPEKVTTEAPPDVTDRPTEVTTKKVWEVDESSLHDCPAPGYYPYEGDCIRFYKCVETDFGKLKGLLYRCPEGYGYSNGDQRCDKIENLPPCDRYLHFHHVRIEDATPLYPEDLIWFFNN